jgi:esterase/lipase superfamily enzyme
VFEMLVFGHAGVPVILFPTSQARYYEYKDFHLIAAARPLVDAGRVTLYCPDAIDGDSWYNHGIHPADRVKTHVAIPHWLDVWRWAKHDWPLWRDMFPRYLAKL